MPERPIDIPARLYYVEKTQEGVLRELDKINGKIDAIHTKLYKIHLDENGNTKSELSPLVRGVIILLGGIIIALATGQFINTTGMFK